MHFDSETNFLVTVCVGGVGGLNLLIQGCYRGKKTGLEIREKSGNPVSSQGKVREFRRWSGKNIKSLYTNKLTAAAPSPSLQTTRRMKQAAKNPGDCVEKSQGKMKNLVWKSGKSQGISLLDSCSNPVNFLFNYVFSTW
ncbi:hypothetical protein J6590_057658 [Homalodisca vitripennis]|nr:hypothetical protein J6590_057658 [Homalodisca vitripennis]